MKHTLCERCEHYSGCGLKFGEKICRLVRTAEPTNYDRVMEMDARQLADFLAGNHCPPGKLYGICPKENCADCWFEYLNKKTKEDLS